MQEGEVTQRRRVRPMQVVDNDENRTLCREACQQPVEPMQDHERRVASLVGLGVRRRRARMAEQRGGERRISMQQVVELVLCLGEQDRLEQLTYDSPGEAALQLSRTGSRDAHPVRVGYFAGSVQKRRFANSRSAFDDDELAASVGGLSQRALDLRQLVVALEQNGAARRCHQGCRHLFGD